MSEQQVLLNAALKRAKQSHPSLSIRSIARICGVSSSYLSKVFHGTRSPSQETLLKICNCLQMDHHEVTALTGKKSDIVEDFKTFAQSEHWVLERWYYYPILALASTRDGFESADALTEKLGLDLNVATNAIRDLEQSGLLTKDEKNIYRPSELRARFPTQRSHPSVRTHHQEMINRALKKLASQPTQKDFSERLISGVTFAGNPEHMQEAKVAIEKGIYQAAEILARGPCTEVFQLNIQLYKHSK